MDDYIQTISKPRGYSVFSDAVFSGEIFCLKDNPNLKCVVDEAQQILCDTFTPFDPELAHRHYEEEECLNRFERAQKIYRASQTVSENFMRALKTVGILPNNGFRDKLILRMVLPNANGGQKGGIGSLPPHRDSWGSGIRCQINWWFPVFPLTKRNTMAIYPDYWSVRVKNDVIDWDWKSKKNETRPIFLPTASEAINDSNRICVTPRPGEAIAFSGAHLHASISNAFDKIRFSSETRTVTIQDINEDRGAPNLDGLCARPGYKWFKRLADGQGLDNILETKKRT